MSLGYFIGRVPQPIRSSIKCGIALKDRIWGSIRRNGVSAYWANALNFGDLITPALLREFGCTPIYVDGAKPQRSACALISCGSILGWCHRDFSGYVLGTGLMARHEAKTLKSARFLAVRGCYTREAMDLPNDIGCADPGLLADIWSKRREKRYLIGLVPHQLDLGTPESIYLFREIADKTGGSCKLISSRQLPSVVAKEISSCKYIFSSSLHGIIFADALGIPRGRVKIKAELDDFKFQDYFSSIGDTGSQLLELANNCSLNQLLEQAKQANQDVIYQKKQFLRNCFMKFFNEINMKFRGL